MIEKIQNFIEDKFGLELTKRQISMILVTGVILVVFVWVFATAERIPTF